MKITDYEKVHVLADSNVFLLDGENGTKTIIAHELATSLLALMSSNEQVGQLVMADLSQTSELASGDRMMVGTSAGVKAITLNEGLYAILDAVVPVEQRRNIFRGKNLGTAFTPEQKTSIRNGTFKGFFIGDYWSIGGKVWRIVDINYWLNDGDTACTTPHLVIMPDSALYNAQMNDTNITTGGYVGSQMYTANLENAKTLVNSAFGSGNILVHREYLTNAVTDGHPSAGAWLDSTVELPNEIMMYGSHVLAPALYTIDKTQLSLMKMYPRFINPSRENQWLRDVVSAALFAYVNRFGDTSRGYASYSAGVRPVFGIVG